MSKFWKIFTTVVFTILFVILVILVIPTKFTSEDYILFSVIGLSFGYMFMLGLDLIIDIYKNSKL